MSKRHQSSTSDHTSLRRAARRYVSPILAGKRLSEDDVERLKREPRAVIDHALLSTSICNRGLVGIPFPRLLNSLAGKIPLPTTGDIQLELNWNQAVLRHHRRSINAFLQLHNQFECAVLVNDANLANQLSDSITHEFGHSFWSIEARFLLAQRHGGLEGNRELLKSIMDEKTGDWVKVVSQHFSARVEDGLSAEDYDRDCSLLRSSKEEQPSVQHVRAYLHLRLNAHRHDDISYLPQILNIEESHSIIDRVFTFIRILRLLQACGESEVQNSIRDIVAEAADGFDCSALKVLSSLLRPEIITADERSSEVFKILHHYTEGRYEQSTEMALQAISKYPNCFELYELAAKASLRSQKALTSPFDVDCLSSELLQKTRAVLERGEESPKAMQRLYKLSYQLDVLPIGGQIFSFAQKHDDQRLQQSIAFTDYPASISTPRLSSTINDHEIALSYLARLNDLYPQNSAVKLFLAIRNALSQKTDLQFESEIPDSRLWKHKASVFEANGKYEDALEAYHELDLLSPAQATLKAEATIGIYRCNLQLGRVLESATILAEAAAVNPQLIARSTLLDVLSQYSSRRDRRWLESISWPILHRVASMEGYAAYDSDQLHDVLDDFLTQYDIRKPSELKQIAEQFSAPCLVILLWHLCTPEILNSSVYYRTQEDVETERIRICEWLAEFDPSNRAAYFEEIAGLSSRATMRELTHKVGQSKIFVDVDGIKDGITQAFIDRVLRCMAYWKLKADLRASVDLIKFTAEYSKNLNIIVIDGGYKIFVQLFNDLKALFLYSNEYGLDSNLSQRIRHGTLLGAIRAQFDGSRLVTQRDSTGNYQDNTYWTNRLGLTEGPQHLSARASFLELSREIDAIALEVRSKWIQIKGPSNDQRGMFDFEFTEDQLNDLYGTLNNVNTVDDFIDLIIESLWKRTESDLDAVRHAIGGELKERFSDALDQCRRTLERTLSSDSIAEFRNAITSCKTQLDYGLASLTEWFHVDHAQRMPPFLLLDLIKALIANVARFCGPSRLNVRQRISLTRSLQGRTFRPFWDLCFILFDNIAKHSKLSEVSVDLDIEEDAVGFRITVSNDLGDSVDTDSLSNTAALMSGNSVHLDQSDLLRQEGGSGLLKIHKILRYDLRLSDYNVELGLMSERRFRAVVTIPDKGMYDENPGGG